MNFYHYQRAFNLAELLIALSIAALVLGVVTPTVGGLLQKSRNTSEINQMHASLNYARGQAIHTRTMVSLCAGDDSCHDSRIWQGNILIFLDSNRNGKLDSHEQLLKTLEINPRLHWHWSNFRQQPHMSFRPDGMTHSLNGTLTLCEDNLALRAVVINITGRAILGAHQDHDRCRG